MTAALGLKGSMSDYELSLLRQRGLAARDSKAQRGELRFALPPGYCWNELGQMEMDPDERVCEAIRMVFESFGNWEAPAKCSCGPFRRNFSYP